MDKVDQAVELAERVVILRAQLREAEGKLRGLVSGHAPVRSQAPTAPVSQKVQTILQDGRAREFGELVEQAGGRPHAQAVRAALKKLRAKKLVRFAGGRYSWAAR
jgi:hypothetical protein